jgi:hypothetical protein
MEGCSVRAVSKHPEAGEDWDWEEEEDKAVKGHSPDNPECICFRDDGSDGEAECPVEEEEDEGEGSDYAEQDPYSSDWDGTESERADAIAERRCEKHGKDFCHRCEKEAMEALNDPEDLPLCRAAAQGNLALTRNLVEEGVRAGDKRGKVVNMSRRWCESEQKCGYTKEFEWNGDTPLIAACREGHAEVVDNPLAVALPFPCRIEQ